MIRTFFIILFTLLLMMFEITAAKQEQIDIIIEILNNNDKKLEKALADHKEILKEKTKLKIVSHRKAYLESEGKTYLLRLLKSFGYYEAEIEVPETTEITKENIITFKVIPNIQYTIETVNIIVPDTSYVPKAQLNMPDREWYKTETNNVIAAKSILHEEQKLQDYIERHNNVLRVEVYHEAIINHPDHNIEINYNVITGPKAYIKKVTFKGLKTVDESYTRKLVGIKDGEDFKISNVKESQQLLQQSGLFTLSEPIIPEKTDSNGGIELQFKVNERKHKSIKTGLNYSTDLGLGAVLAWEHRNIFSKGEKFSSTLTATKKEQILENHFQKPCFLDDNQTLKLNNIIGKKETLAYRDKSVSLAGTLEREFTNKIKGGAGIKYSFNKIQDNTDNIKNFGLLSLPLYGTYDSRDNILNPSRGILVNTEISPFFNTINSNEKFMKEMISGSWYIQAESTLEPTLALKGEIGMISGGKTTNIPATERFYAGGAGSVRGYGYQLIGPLNEKNEPLGGRSYTETSAEFRFKVTKKVGLAIFSDGGNVYDSNYGKFGKKMVWGAGFGVRYYTDFGPLRADIAFPVTKRRHKIDRPFQLYFSIGQAF